MSNEAFVRWARRNNFDLGSYSKGYHSISTRAALEAWQARQPEIDALKEKQRLFEADTRREGDKMNVPEGWKLVPVEMTGEMKDASQRKIELILRVGLPEYDLTDGVEMAWDAALAAAPTPPAPEVEPVAEVVRFADGPWGEIYKTYVNVPSGTKLYAHPANDGLRKAAEKALDILEDYHAGEMEIADTISVLKKALANK